MAKLKDIDLTFGLIPSTETGKKNVRYKVQGQVSEVGYKFLTKDPELTKTLDLCRHALDEAQNYLDQDSQTRRLVLEAMERLG